jgi:DNA-binding protein H-NS
MSVDQLWNLYVEVGTILRGRLEAEIRTIHKRLAELDTGATKSAPKGSGRRRFRNPSNPAQSWSGKGRMPKWLERALALGRTLEDYEIPARRQHQK